MNNQYSPLEDTLLAEVRKHAVLQFKNALARFGINVPETFDSLSIELKKATISYRSEKTVWVAGEGSRVMAEYLPELAEKLMACGYKDLGQPTGESKARRDAERELDSVLAGTQ